MPVSSRSGRGRWPCPAFSVLLATFAFCGPATAATYHVRVDGGDASQCTGRADAAYPGSGSGRACAWKHPYYALPTSGSPRIAGGDTLIIGPGDYMIGWGAPGSSGGRCYAGGPYDCYLPAIPSGPSATARTRILGKGHDTGCAAPPVLWGNERVSTIFNLEGSANVEVGCLEITDRSDCVEFHSNAGARCQRNAAPYGQWGSIGVSANNSRNVFLRDLDIHGLAHTGIHAGGLTDWTLERVKINGNGWVGWDGDIGSGSSNSGQIILRRVEIGWNGCGQRWQTGAYWACWAQQAGGYGDGLGTATTGGQWLIEDAFIHHNTSDGIDLLYLDGAATTSVVLRRVHAYANAGNQLKTTGNATIENSVVIGQCAYFNGRDFMVAGDHCRAQGNVLSVGLGAGHTANLRHNTLTGEGDCLILTEGGNASSRVNVQNNALVGQSEYGGGGELTCGHYADNSSAVVSFSGNLFWNVKASQCPGGGNTCGQNPRLASLALVGFDADPLAGSPLIDRAPAIGLGNDFYLQSRPSGTAPDIGAIEVQVGRRAPSMSSPLPPTPVGPAGSAAAQAVASVLPTSLERSSSGGMEGRHQAAFVSRGERLARASWRATRGMLAAAERQALNAFNRAWLWAHQQAEHMHQAVEDEHPHSTQRSPAASDVTAATRSPSLTDYIPDTFMPLMRKSSTISLPGNKPMSRSDALGESIARNGDAACLAR